MNLIQTIYKELLRLSVEQSFYQNAICRNYQTEPALDIAITPTESCLNIMKRMDLVFRKTDINGGFVVLGHVSGTNTAGDDLLRFPAGNSDALSFLMLLKNSETVVFNDLPVQPDRNFIYYFSNDITDAGAPRNNLHITKGASGVNGVNDVIKKASANYQFHHIAVVLPDTAVVKHVLSGQTVQPTSLITQGGQSDISFNLSLLPVGKCQLLINNLPVDTFYYLGNYYTQPVFGIIELLLSATLAANYRIVEADRSLTPQRPLYLIRFNNRSTRWRYTIWLKDNSPLYLEMSELSPADKTDFINKLNIETNDTAITFSQATATDTQFVFVSDNPILLQEKYFSSTSVSHDALILTLKKYTGDATREAVIKTNLQYPSTRTIDAATPPDIFSDIFLTL